MTEASGINKLSMDNIINIIKYCGLVVSAFQISGINKTFHKAFLNYLHIHDHRAVEARLEEFKGRQFNELLDYIRFIAYDLRCVSLSNAAEKSKLKDHGDLYKLRTPSLYADLNRLNAGGYSYWHSVGFDGFSEGLYCFRNRSINLFSY